MAAKRYTPRPIRRKSRDAVGMRVRTTLGLDDTDYLLTAGAPTPPAKSRP